MSISVATAGVAPSAPSSGTAPAAPAAGAGDLAFQKLLETFSSGVGPGGKTSPPLARGWTDRAAVTGAMPADLASASAGTVRGRSDAAPETDARPARSGDSSDLTATLGNLPILQVLPLSAPASLPVVDAPPAGPSAAPSGPSIAAADARDRTSGPAADSRTSTTDPSSIAVAGIAGNQPAIDVDGNRAAGSADGQAHPQADGFGAQPRTDKTTRDTRTATASSSLTAAYGANSAGTSVGVQPAALAAHDLGSAIGQSQASGNPTPQVGASVDPRNDTISGQPMGSHAPAASANAHANRAIARTRPDSAAFGRIVPDAAGAASLAGAAGSGLLQFDASSPDGQTIGTSSSLTSTDPGAPRSSELGATATVTLRDPAVMLASPATTVIENPAGGAADRRSAAGVRLAAALARGARAEGTSGAGRADAPLAAGGADRIKRVAALSVDPDLRGVSSVAAADVNTPADRRVTRLWSEPLLSTFGAAAAAVEQMPLRAGIHEFGDARTAMAPAVELASDVKASGQAALFAASVGVAGVGAPSSHAVTTAVATAQPALDPAAESDLPRQIVQAMRLQWKDGIGDARIRLLPEYLGELSIAIRVEHGTVMAALEASTPAVRQWIESHEPMLRQSLAEQGLHLDRLIVSDEPPQSSLSRERRREQGDETQQEQEPQPRRRPPADDTTFEVLV